LPVIEPDPGNSENKTSYLSPRVSKPREKRKMQKWRKHILSAYYNMLTEI
jgi:hypothetical protein